MMWNREDSTADRGTPTLAFPTDDTPGTATTQDAPFIPATAAESFRVAFQHATVGTAIFELGPGGERWFLVANQAAAEIFGTTQHDLVGRNLADFCDSDDHEDRQQATEVVLGLKKAYVRRRRYRRVCGGTVLVELRAHRIELFTLPRTTVLAHFLDITARREAEEHRALMAATKAAVARLTTKVLSGASLPELYQLIADKVARIFGAENVFLGVVDPLTGHFETRAAVGEAAERMLSGEVEPSEEFCRRMLRLGSLAIAEPEPHVLEGLAPTPGPGAAARFGPEAGGGLIMISRPTGAEPFTEMDVELLGALAQQVALAVELAQARADQERLSLLEVREHIARDLHDTVIQDLIAIGMQLDAGLAGETDPARRTRHGMLVDQLEEAIRRLRGSVFDLHEVPTGRSFDETVRVIAAEASRVLGHLPNVKIEGYLDTVPASVSFSALAVLREALSNVARHARASATGIRLSVGEDRVRLVVDDDGRGLPERPAPGDGLGNIQERAVALGGSATVGNRPGGGTRLTWSCPLTGQVTPGRPAFQ